MEQSAAFITRYGLYNLLKDDMKDFFCSQEAEIATPSPDLSYVPYTGTNFSIVILIYLQKYLYPKIFIYKNIYIQKYLLTKIFASSEEQSPWAAVAGGLDTSHLYRRTGDSASSSAD